MVIMVKSDLPKTPVWAQKAPMKPARTLSFKCKTCTKPVTLYLQKVSACSHIQPYLGVCSCGEPYRHATGEQDAVKSCVFSLDGSWRHHH